MCALRVHAIITVFHTKKLSIKVTSSKTMKRKDQK